MKGPIIGLLAVFALVPQHLTVEKKRIYPIPGYYQNDPVADRDERKLEREQFNQEMRILKKNRYKYEAA